MTTTTPKYQATKIDGVDSIDDLDEKVPPLHMTDRRDLRQDNDARASFGAVVLVAYTKQVGDCGEVETQLSDLLSDLRHMCDAIGIDYDAADATAHMHYCQEIHGETD